jgi:hypothetical protein
MSIMTFLKGWRRVVLVVAACIIAMLISMTRSHWWTACRGATVSSQGKVIANASVYSSRGEEFVLVYLKEQKELYLINLPEQRIVIPNRSSFVIIPGLAFSKNMPPGGAPMGKAEIDPKLVISDDSVEFTSIDNSRIKLGLRPS